uniref:Uncharacterized protein n=1 Tax=Schistosoma japonicum TaxID=6182 RepID=Q5BVQ4_SCHJA|nr:unknown [Schistosoma japonicum]
MKARGNHRHSHYHNTYSNLSNQQHLTPLIVYHQTEYKSDQT